MHQLDVRRVLLAGAAHQQFLAGQPPRARPGFDEPAHHRFDERVQPLRVEAVEAVAERAQRDRVEGEPGRVVGDVDAVLRALAFPLEQQLLGDVGHAVEHGAQRGGAERGHQDAVRGLPVRFLGPRGEQPVAREVADVDQGGAEGLVEPLLVAQLVDELLGLHDDQAPAGQLEPEDRAVLGGHLHEAQHALAAVEFEQVAHERLRLGLRDRDEFLGGGHRHLLRERVVQSRVAGRARNPASALSTTAAA
ncbi:hypothetical protein GCM10020366_02070 [Saccharopolyspora gregorii]|uniref:Uncharacterized protein n=1 Tax=Saccharopolyspora gregorii TaxID=33914 RepID=A0ABP6RH07_9PSEU